MNPCDFPGLMPLEQALNILLQNVTCVPETETVCLSEARDRICAQPVHAPINVPLQDNSAMDGYAFRHADLKHTGQLRIVARVLAGAPYQGELKSGECVRIMTGGVLPRGTDTVVMQEHVDVINENITLVHPPPEGDNVRLAGEDIQSGSEMLPSGIRIGAAHIALLASVGINNLVVKRKVRVGILATGDELCRPGSELQNGQIYESNGHALKARLQSANVEVIDQGIVPDEPGQLKTRLANLAKDVDLVVSTGGVSVGEADYVKQVLDELGSINFWKVAIKPGKPFAFGKLGNTLFCGLPGNPVSAWVTFEQLVTPLLDKLSGISSLYRPLQIPAIASENIRKRPGRADFQRGLFWLDDHGQVQVKALKRQGSGVMSSITSANCYIVLPREQSDVAAGEQVFIQPFKLTV